MNPVSYEIGSIADAVTNGGSITVKQWLMYWYETYAKNTIKRSTAVSYTGYINNHIPPSLGDVYLRDLNVPILQNYFNGQYEHGNARKKGMGISPKTLSNLKLMLHKAFKKALSLDLIRANFIDCVELPRILRPEMRVLSAAEQERYANSLRVSDERLYFGALLSLETGMRLGEVLGLRWGDVDLKNDTIHVRRTLNRLSKLSRSATVRPKTEIYIGTPKSRSGIRDIPIPRRLHEDFVVYLDRLRDSSGVCSFSDDDHIITLNSGKPVTPTTMQRCFSRTVQSAGIENVNFHALRHTFATRAIERGADAKTLSVILGHADVATTLNRYCHVLDDQKRKTMELISEDYA